MFLDYRLKHVAAQLLNIHMPEFPGQIELAPYAVHTPYLTSDLVGTRRLYEHLWPRLSRSERHYYQRLVGPLVHVLTKMTVRGAPASLRFIQNQSAELSAMIEQLSNEHQQQHGVALGMDARQMTDWLHRRLGIPVLKQRRSNKGWLPSLDAATIKQHRQLNQDPRIDDSLATIQQYRQAVSLLTRLRSLSPHVDRRDGRIHAGFDDRQSTGRISCSEPNLQQLAKPQEVAGKTIRSRDVLAAPAGFEFVACDIGQADVRVLASAVENFPFSSEEHQHRLRRERDALVLDHVGPYLSAIDACRNPNYRSQPQPRPQFTPHRTCRLAEDFRTPGDFYAKAATRMLGRPPRDKAERNFFKPIILSVINGKGPPSLARDLGCTPSEAKGHLEAFAQAYPQVTAYKWLTYWQIAYTGRVTDFMDRTRTVTAHRRMTVEPKVEILVTYRNSDRYWVELVPLVPSLRVLTSYVLRVWDARRGNLIYDHDRGRLSQRNYRLFDYRDLLYRLPIRNWGWRSIRRVRARGEEATYLGFDTTARSAFNFIAQSGTAEIAKLMMLRSEKICRLFGAELILQIHDELVFLVPQARSKQFIRVMRGVLQRPPVRQFKVPILIEAKRGRLFGELVDVPQDKWLTVACLRLNRASRRLTRRVCKIRHSTGATRARA